MERAKEGEKFSPQASATGLIDLQPALEFDCKIVRGIKLRFSGVFLELEDGKGMDPL